MFLFAVNWDNSWQYLTILGDTWRYLAISDNSFTILSNTKQYLPILNNIYQLITIPNNTWQTWYRLVSAGIAKASSIAANTIPVSWRYHHDTVLTVFCLSGIVTVPVLAIFTKPSTLSLNPLIIDSVPSTQHSLPLSFYWCRVLMDSLTFSQYKRCKCCLRGL